LCPEADANPSGAAISRCSGNLTPMVAEPGREPRCADTLLVGTEVWLPDDPRERFIAMPDWIGCNRLFCESCRSWVRHLDNLGFAASVGPPPTSNLESLYFDAHPEQYAGFSRGWLSRRVYLCRCECTAIGGVQPTAMHHAIDTWHCAGHPPPRVSEAVTPPQPTTHADVKAMLRTSTSSWLFALQWRPPFLFRSVWPAVSDFLVDPDPVLRARGLEFVQAWKVGSAATFDRVIDLAENHPSLFRENTLRSLLVATLSQKAAEFPAFSKAIAKAIDGLKE
jgi:hypothetical protein